MYQWILNLFDISSFDKLAKGIKEPEQEGFDEDNVTRFYHILNARMFDRKELPSDILLGYDQNIVRHWNKITQRREQLHPEVGELTFPTAGTYTYLSVRYRKPGTHGRSKGGHLDLGLVGREFPHEAVWKISYCALI